MQSFIHSGLFPSSLKEVLDKLLARGLLFDRQVPKVEKEQPCICLGFFSKKNPALEVDSDLIHKDYLE